MYKKHLKVCVVIWYKPILTSSSWKKKTLGNCDTIPDFMYRILIVDTHIIQSDEIIIIINFLIVFFYVLGTECMVDQCYGIQALIMQELQHKSLWKSNSCERLGKPGMTLAGKTLSRKCGSGKMSMWSFAYCLLVFCCNKNWWVLFN